MPTKDYSLDDIKRLQKKRDARIGWTDIRDAKLGARVNGVKRVPVSNKRNEVYVRVAGERGWTTAKRGSVNTADFYDTDVQVGYPPNTSELTLFAVIEKAATAGTGGSTTTSGAAPHGFQHGLKYVWGRAPQPGEIVDPVFISQLQIRELGMTPGGGISVTVLPGMVEIGGAKYWWSGGNTGSLSAELPGSANSAKIALIELNTSAALQVSYGSEFTLPITLTDVVAGYLPLENANARAVGYVWLENGATALYYHHFYPLAAGAGAGAAGGSLWPPNVVLDDNGAVVLDDNGQIVFDDSLGPVYPPQPPLMLPFGLDGEAYIALPVTATFSSAFEIGTGTISYEVALAAAPSSFSSDTLPITIAPGDILKVIATGVVGYKTLALTRSR